MDLGEMLLLEMKELFWYSIAGNARQCIEPGQSGLISSQCS